MKEQNLIICPSNGTRVCSPFGECGFINDFLKAGTPLNKLWENRIGGGSAQTLLHTALCSHGLSD